MAKKPFISFQTREEFDKCLKDMYNEGYKSGFRDGKVNGLAHVLVGIEDQFDEKMIAESEHQTRGIHIKQWKKQVEFQEGIKKLGVTEYLKAQENK